MSQQHEKNLQVNRTDYVLEAKENKRRYARLDIALSVSYALKSPGGEVSELAEAMSSDISAGGLRLMTPGPLLPGDLLDLEISICGSEDTPIRANGEVVWQNKITDTSYETGTIIKYVNDNDKQRFMNFVFEQMSRLMGVSSNPMVH
ncbi:MAG: PilZ domain-containing protein [Deltaproteobacteria bacterium]|nr:MAG: PilZ domain-containing protein [Deltaproteobacteria bacterium]